MIINVSGSLLLDYVGARHASTAARAVAPDHRLASTGVIRASCCGTPGSWGRAQSQGHHNETEAAGEVSLSPSPKEMGMVTIP